MPTGPRPGSPNMVNLGSSVIQAMLGDLPHAWLLSLYALIDPISFPVDELCAVRAPDPETWTFNDAVLALDPGTNPLIIDKLIRMAKASVWNTYCQEIRPAEDLNVTGPLTWLHEVGGPEMPDILGRPIVDFGVADPLADLWILTTQCFENPTVGNPPQITVSNQAGDEFNVRMGMGYSTAFGMVISVFNQTTLFPSLDGQGGSQPWPETADRFRMLSNGSDGRWGTSLTAWKLRPVPDTAWATAPADPMAPEFSEACRALLCTMAGEWSSSQLGQQLLFGAIETARASLETITADQSSATLAAISNIPFEPQQPSFSALERADLNAMAAAWPDEYLRSLYVHQSAIDLRNGQAEIIQQIGDVANSVYSNSYQDWETNTQRVLAAIAAGDQGSGPLELDWASSAGPAAQLQVELGDAVGVMLTIVDRPEGRSWIEGEPDRFPNLASLTFGNWQGSFPSLEVDHENSVWFPLPPSATLVTVSCQPPMLATITLYRRPAP